MISLIVWCNSCRSHLPSGLRRSSAAARLLIFWVRIPPGVWMSVFWECCVLSGRGLCDDLITRPDESYRMWCVVVCDIETSWKMRPWPTGGGGWGDVASKTKTMGKINSLVEAIYFVPDFSSSACIVSISFTKYSITEYSFLQHDCYSTKHVLVLRKG